MANSLEFAVGFYKLISELLNALLIGGINLLFSQRQGLKPVKQIIQIDNIDDDLRTDLWNVFTVVYWEEETYSYRYIDSKLLPLLREIWRFYFKKPLSDLGNWSKDRYFIKNYFFNCHWYEVYDLIEFIAKYGDNQSENFMRECNHFLEKNVSGYRFVDGKITQITSLIEIDSIEQAIQDSNVFNGASIHLRTALNLLSDRKNPDYRNSIKESISAVEAVCCVLANDTNATLGKALKIIEPKIKLHSSLKSAFEKLYGYTSDADGIRHALLDEPNINFEDAKFMLVSCSAFVSYLTAKSKDYK